MLIVSVSFALLGPKGFIRSVGWGRDFSETSQNHLPSSRDRPQTPCTSAFQLREVLIQHLLNTSRFGVRHPPLGTSSTTEVGREVYGRSCSNSSRALAPLYEGVSDNNGRTGGEFGRSAQNYKKIISKMI